MNLVNYLERLALFALTPLQLGQFQLSVQAQLQLAIWNRILLLIRASIYCLFSRLLLTFQWNGRQSFHLLFVTANTFFYMNWEYIFESNMGPFISLLSGHHSIINPWCCRVVLRDNSSSAYTEGALLNILHCVSTDWHANPKTVQSWHTACMKGKTKSRQIYTLFQHEAFVFPMQSFHCSVIPFNLNNHLILLCYDDYKIYNTEAKNGILQLASSACQWMQLDL